MAAEFHRLVREPGDQLGVVAGERHGQAVLPGEVQQQRADLVAQFGVQAGGGLVQEQDVGAAGQGPGEGHPALLAAGERARAPGGQAAVVRQADLGEERAHRVPFPVGGEFPDEGADPHAGLRPEPGSWPT